MSHATRAHQIYVPHGILRGAVCAMTVALFAAPAAFADARRDAKRHFRDGMALIASGQVERGIAELKQAYAVKPHADLLYNIARAYVDLGRIPEALDYFQRYVATDPDDRAQVEAVIARLSGAIGARPPVAQTPAPSVDTSQLLAALQELIERNKAPATLAASKGAAARAAPANGKEKDEEGMFEATSVAARTRATAQEIASALEGGRTDEDIFEEQVVTAGVHASSEAKAPASLTVITADEIRLTGAATIPEILRRVPGVDVAEMNPSDTNVSVRGFNRRIANKVLVLVDGRSVYQDFLGATLWPLLDVSVQDIARIEVIRGPGSALYGANAYAGVVNIITKTGDEVNGGRAFLQTGNYGTVQGAVSAGGRNGKLTYRTSLAYDRADKWSNDAPPGFSSQFSQPGRSREIQRAEIAADYQSSGLQVRAGAGFDNMNAMEVFPLGSLRTFGNEGQGGFLRAEASSGETDVKIYWNALRMRSGPEYWPTALPSILASVRADVIDASARTGLQFQLLGRHRFNFGAGFRYSTVDWGFLTQRADGGTRYTQEHFSGFLQDEWEPSRRVTVTLSYRVDRHPLLADQHITAGGLVHSPRGTVLLEVARDHFLRRADRARVYRLPERAEPLRRRRRRARGAVPASRRRRRRRQLLLREALGLHLQLHDRSRRRQPILRDRRQHRAAQAQRGRQLAHARELRPGRRRALRLHRDLVREVLRPQRPCRRRARALRAARVHAHQRAHRVPLHPRSPGRGRGLLQPARRRPP